VNIGRVLIIVVLVAISLYAEELKITLSKASIYESEPLIATLSFRSDSKNLAQRVEKAQFRAKDFEIKKIDENLTEIQKGVFSYTSHYLLYPKKIGTLTIPPQSIKIYRVDKSSYLSLPKSYSTPKLNIEVKALPQDIEFAGDIKLFSSIDKQKASSNEPITLTLKIEGVGNLNDIEPICPKIKGVTTLCSSIKTDLKLLPNGEYGGSWIEHISFVSQDSFKIAPIELKYLNSSTSTIEILSTKAYSISIDNPIQKERLFTLLIGIIIGVVSAIIFKFLKFKRAKLDITKRVKRAKSDKELYSLLLPFSNHKEISIWIERLEENIYKNANNRIDRGEIISMIETIYQNFDNIADKKG